MDTNPTNTDVSGNPVANINFLNSIINELLNEIDDDEIENPSMFNPFSIYNHRIPRGNFTIGTNIQSGTSLYNMVNRLFDTSMNVLNRNVPRNENSNVENEEQEETNQTPIIEEVTFHITYPTNVRIPTTRNLSTSPDHDAENDVENESEIESNNQSTHIDNSNNNTNFNMRRNALNQLLHRNYFTPIRSFPTNALERILTQSLYDESAYKKKISDKVNNKCVI